MVNKSWAENKQKQTEVFSPSLQILSVPWTQTQSVCVTVCDRGTLALWTVRSVCDCHCWCTRQDGRCLLNAQLRVHLDLDKRRCSTSCWLQVPSPAAFFFFAGCEMLLCSTTARLCCVLKLVTVKGTKLPPRTRAELSLRLWVQYPHCCSWLVLDVTLHRLMLVTSSLTVHQFEQKSKFDDKSPPPEKKKTTWVLHL